MFIYGIIEHLLPRHEVTLVSFCDKKELVLSRDLLKLPLECHFVPRGKGAQKNNLWNAYLVLLRSFQLARSIIFWQPYYVSKFRHPRMARLIKRLTQCTSYDVVQVEFTQMAQYRKSVRSGKTFLHEIDVSFRPAYRRYKKATSPFKKVVMFIEWCRWALYEPKIVKQFDHVLSVTEQDKRLLQRLSGMKHISYFSSGVDVAKSIPEYASRDPQTILFVGTFSHHPNVDAALWLCHEIFPLVSQRFPKAMLYLIGTNPSLALSEFGKRNHAIRVLGFVEDIIPYFQRCSVFVAPLRYGGGVKVKILHAMARGVPVVTTKVGAEGIEGVNSENILIGNSAQEFSDNICSLLQNPERAMSIGKHGWENVRTHYSWEIVVHLLEEIYRSVLVDESSTMSKRN